MVDKRKMFWNEKVFHKFQKGQFRRKWALLSRVKYGANSINNWVTNKYE